MSVNSKAGPPRPNATLLSQYVFVNMALTKIDLKNTKYISSCFFWTLMAEVKHTCTQILKMIFTVDVFSLFFYNLNT